MQPNQIIMQDARKQLSGQWALAILSFFVVSVILGGIGAIGVPAVSIPVGLILGGPLEFGVVYFSLRLARGKKVEFMQIFKGFKQRIERSFVTYLLVVLFTTLWTLLLIVPGIVASLAYSQTFFILNDDKKIDALDAITKSKKMMHGYKWTFFCLNLRFIGWFILSILTFGIGFLWLIPYIRISYAGFYEKLKKVQE